jgi:hypothetical protein
MWRAPVTASNVGRHLPHGLACLSSLGVALVEVSAADPGEPVAQWAQERSADVSSALME